MFTRSRSSGTLRLIARTLAILAMAMLHSPGLTLAGAPVFEAQAPLDLHSAGVGDLETGDLNGDGHLDIVAVTGTGASSITLLRGRGDGTFESLGVLGIAGNPGEISVADLNGDGALDIVVAASDPAGIQQGVIATFLGHGDGAFSEPLLRQVLPAPADVIAGDMDADGTPDIAITKLGAPGVFLLSGAGDGTFGIERMIDPGGGVFRLTTGYLNRDGQLDLIVTKPGLRGLPAGEFDVLLGRGGGRQWQNSGTHEVGNVRFARVADLDADGALDVAALACRDAGASELCRIFVHPGSPQGALGAGLPTLTAFDAQDLLVGDLDGDGLVDAVATGSGEIWIHPGRGDGTFDLPMVLRLHIGTYRLLHGDFDEDGRPDLAVGVVGTSGPALQIFLNRQGP